MKKLLPYLKPYRPAASAAMLLVFLHSIADLALPRLMAEIVDSGVIRGEIGTIFRVGSMMVAVALAGSAAAVLASFLSARSALGFGRDLRAAAFSRAMSCSLHEFDSFGTSTLITRATNDVSQLQNFTLAALHMLARAPLMLLGSLALAFATDASLSLLLAAALPFLAAAVVLVARKGLPLFKVVQEKTDALGRVLREGLTGVRVVRAFNREDAERARFGRANEELFGVSLSAQRVMALLGPAMMVLMNLAGVAVVWFGGGRAAAGDLRIGDLMAFLQYATHILFSLMVLSHLFVMLPRAQVSAARVAAVLEARPSVSDPERPVSRNAASGARRGTVEFRDVSFRYPGAEEWALEGISFAAPPGGTTAIIGGTGAGKSTLLSLVPRFYDAVSGSVLVDGVDVRSLALADLRARIGCVPQKSVLFTGTVADNIRYGKPDADEAGLRRAAGIAQAAEFIEALGEGYGAAVSQGGANFSGGQKQRLCIARALVREPEVYLIDDGFSALDFRTDRKLRSALKRSLGPRAEEATIVIVAQRVGTVMDADRIVVLDEGRIAGIGAHAELLETCSVYREIAESQLERPAAGEAV